LLTEPAGVEGVEIEERDGVDEGGEVERAYADGVFGVGIVVVGDGDIRGADFLLGVLLGVPLGVDGALIPWVII